MTAEIEQSQCELIDKEYTRRPFYGSRKMVVYLRSLGQIANRKRVHSAWIAWSKHYAPMVCQRFLIATKALNLQAKPLRMF